MVDSVHIEAIELLLSAIYRNGDGYLRHSFLYGRPGAPMWERRFGDEIFYNKNKMIRASIYVRQHGPTYLTHMSMNDVWSMLTAFVADNYWHLGSEVFFSRFECSYAEYISNAAKIKMAAALSQSRIFQPHNTLTLFPLVPVRVRADFDSVSFFLIRPRSLDRSRVPEAIPESAIVAEQFPPVADWQGRRDTPASWLGVRSPAVQASFKMKAAILGAVALTPGSGFRHSFSGRSMFGGVCTLDTGATISIGDAHTPPMMHDIEIGEADHEWLAMLAAKLLAPEQDIRKQIRALEYFYRAWPLDPSERFPWLFMALDAIFGDAARATRAVIEAVEPTMEGRFDDKRLNRLMGLRASVIHGGAPDVFESKKYQSYYEDYAEDPIFDLECIAAQCFRFSIFEGKLKEHSSPYEKRVDTEGTAR